jgi:mRNA interferase HigB
MVNVVSRKKLMAFWRKHPEATEPLTIWYRTLRKSRPKNFAELKSIFNSVDLASKYTIFDIGGNKFRVIIIVDYTNSFAKIRHVFTHQEYDLWNAKAEQKLEPQKIKAKKGKQHDA